MFKMNKKLNFAMERVLQGDEAQVPNERRDSNTTSAISVGEAREDWRVPSLELISSPHHRARRHPLPMNGWDLTIFQIKPPPDGFRYWKMPSAVLQVML
jgi:hypothetical protein